MATALATLRSSVMFDAVWYRKSNPDLSFGSIDPAQHYLEHGAQEGRDPHPLFDTQWYVEHNPDVARAGINPLVHYLRDGWREKRNPHPLFDIDWYRKQLSETDAQAEPLVHYLTIGWRQKLSPHPLFDVEYYRAHSLVGESCPPLLHFVLSDPQHQQSPHPLFDFDWYRKNNPALDTSQSPLLHYLRTGWRDNRVPCAIFDPVWYLKRYPDVANAGINPFLHYVRSGALENRLPNPKFDGRWQSEHDGAAAARLVPDQLGASQLPEETLPHVAIISVLYNKSHIVGDFLVAVYRQTYSGDISIVLVDDCSSEAAYALATATIAQHEDGRPSHTSIRLIRNEQNQGNCISRNRGLSETNADIYIVIDVDCLINKDFVAAHVRERLRTGADVVVGPLNLETEGRPGLPLVAELEEDRSRVLAMSRMQDDIQANAFVNCITRNLSFSRSFKDRLIGFDPRFSYRADLTSGYGWEDVEFGYRLYAGGASIHFTPEAFSVHQTHRSAVDESRQIVGSACNYNKLFDTHPEMAYVARRWATDTAFKIIAWAERAGVAHPELDRVRARFKKSHDEIKPFLETWRTGQRRLRIVTHRWHVPHQYEIYKLPHDFTLLTGTGTGFTNDWEYRQRPLRPNVRLLPAVEYNPKDYDLAVIHFDENVLCPQLSNNTLSDDWGRTFEWFMAHRDLPAVAVCHGTPPFVGQYAANPERIEHFEVLESERLRLVDLLRDVEVVCNSHQAAQEWQFHRCRVIWHGIDPQEFPPGSHELGVVSHGTDRHRPHYRGTHDLHSVMSLLGPDVPVASHKHEGPKLVLPDDPSYAQCSYRAWIDHLRRYKIYLNTTLRSPMPRSRTEAMMCGVIPVSLRNHDVDHFIINGVNGFYGDSPEELVDAIRFLLGNERARAKIAKAGRETAAQTFNHDRFLTEWTRMLQSMGV